MKEKTRKWLLYYPNNDLCQSRKICEFQKVLLKNNDVNSPLPHPSLQQSRRRPKKSPGYGCYRGPTCTYSKQGL